MKFRNFQEKMEAAGGPVEMMRGVPPGAYIDRRVPAEFSNWRDEQRAWRETAALLDLTHHMTDLCIEGPDAVRLLSDLAINSFANFRVNLGKQFVCCNREGYLIGDGILFYVEPNKIRLLGLPAAHNWVQYHAQGGRYEVRVDREDASVGDPYVRRKLYRYQVQGPNALKVLHKATNGTLPDIKFFNMGEFVIAGRRVRALRHGMAGAPGLELFGPWDDGEQIRTAILEAGEEFGLRRVGRKAYPTTTLESGWIPAPVPAIHGASAEFKAYREWLPADSFETVSLGGSFDSTDIADYYVTPIELGYGGFIKYDHEFIGREALQRMGDAPKRRKVTLAWNPDDILGAFHTLFESGNPAQYVDLPWANYGLHHDKILKDDRCVGISRCAGYSYNEREMLSLAILETGVPLGSEVTIIWGSPEHRQLAVRAIVCPCPYAEATRSDYAQGGWRARSKP